jgi:cytochrome c553
MRKLTILSVVTASLLLIGCGQDKATETKAETVKEKATKAVEAVKTTTTNAVQKTKEVAHEATQKVAKVVQTAKGAVSSAPASYAKCAGCHGKDGKTKALGKSAIIAGQAKADLIKKIGEYKAGTRNVSGMGGLMKGQVSGLSDADIAKIATYVSGLK